MPEPAPRRRVRGEARHPMPHWRPAVTFWRQLMDASPPQRDPGRLDSEEQALRTASGNTLRAAVLGANDGLVTNLSLVMGVSGASLGAKGILITGAAGLLSGALSMALGEWLSVQNARELHERQLEIEGLQLLVAPEAERQEFVEIYENKGLSESEAEKLADRLMTDKSAALDTMAREEWGLDPEDLGGSPIQAALSSFALFAIGALVPLVPFFFGAGIAEHAWSIGLCALGLFGGGVVTTHLTGRNPIAMGLRQVFFGLLAAAITYGAGYLLHATLTR